MTVPTVAWDESSPPGTQGKNLGPARLREMKTQVREIISVDHKMASSGQHADTGKHEKVTLLTGSAPTHGADKVILYGKDVGGKCELFARDEDGNEVQITSAGKVNAVRLADAQTITGVKTFTNGFIVPLDTPSSLANGMIWFEE